MSETHETTPELMKQIADQCRVVSHLATALAKVHDDYAEMMGVVPSMENIAYIVGDRSAAFMEKLGDMLNAMDACDEEDKWTVPVFHEAQRLWPQSPERFNSVTPD